MNQAIFNHDWNQLLHHNNHSLTKEILLEKAFVSTEFCVFLRLDIRFSCKHFWTNILLLLLQTANTMVETKIHKWRHANLT